jgi:hypothetical protein
MKPDHFYKALWSWLELQRSPLLLPDGLNPEGQANFQKMQFEVMLGFVRGWGDVPDLPAEAVPIYRGAREVALRNNEDAFYECRTLLLQLKSQLDFKRNQAKR